MSLAALPVDTLLEIVSFLTVEEYCKSFTLVCSSLHETYNYEFVWSVFYKSILERDIKIFTTEKETASLNTARGLYKKHINGPTKSRTLVGEQFLTATREYFISSKQRKLSQLINKFFKKPTNLAKRRIETYEEFIHPYEIIFAEVDKLLAYVSGTEDAERRRTVVQNNIRERATYHGKTVSAWLVTDLGSVLQLEDSPTKRELENRAVEYTNTMLKKLVFQYNVSIMGDWERKRAKVGAHFILVEAIHIMKEHPSLLETVIELYKYEQEELGRELYYSPDLLDVVIKKYGERKDLLSNPVILIQDEVRNTISEMNSTTQRYILCYNNLEAWKELVAYGFDPKKITATEMNSYLRQYGSYISHEAIVWLLEHGLRVYNGSILCTPLLNSIIYATEPRYDSGMPFLPLETVELILNHPDVDIESREANNGFNAITDACYYNPKHSLTIVKMLIDKGADPFVEHDRRTALGIACNTISDEEFDEFEPLLTNDVTVRKFDQYQESPARKLIIRFPTDHTAKILRKWIDKYNLDLNAGDPDEPEPTRKTMRQWATDEGFLELTTEVFELLGLPLE